MTAPVFVVDDGSLAAAGRGSLVELGGPEGRHAVHARRLRAGEALDIVDGRGRRASGEVAEVAGSVLRVRVLGIEDEPRPSVRIVVVVALIKGDRFDDALTMLTEVGVDEIVPWAAQRCIAQWRGDRAERGLRRAGAVVVEAGKQSRRARFPEVAALARTSDVVARTGRATAAVVLHEAAARPLTSADIPKAGEVVLIVGPEGGLTDEEVAALEAAGAQPARMGRSVQRAATAAVSSAALVLAACGRWD